MTKEFPRAGPVSNALYRGLRVLSPGRRQWERGRRFYGCSKACSIVPEWWLGTAPEVSAIAGLVGVLPALAVASAGAQLDA
jgi:hypothetical protein